MSQLVLPHTIDTGTEILAVEHQANYTAIRNLLNGGLEGGGGADNNFKADGVTARELADAIMDNMFGRPSLQEGVLSPGGLKVTPGAGLQLNYALGRGMITDDSGIIAMGALLPALVATGSTVTIPANASGNPRIDQIILTLTGFDTGTVSVLQGTASVGATLDNRTGAANLPLGAIRLADILMPNGFAGPFVQATHVRDRRPWARGAYVKIVRNADAGGLDDYSQAATGALVELDAVNLKPRLEFSGAPVRVSLRSQVQQTAAAGVVILSPLLNGAGIDGVTVSPAGTGPFAANIALGANSGGPVSVSYDFVPAAGSHRVSWAVAVTAGTTHFLARAAVPLQMTVEEIIRDSASNDGA